MPLPLIKLLQPLCLALLVSSGAYAANTSADNLFLRAIDSIGNSADSVGLAVAVVRAGEISLLETYGVREIGLPEHIDTQTTFRIASLSKAFAATVASDLVTNNQLSLDAPIFDYSPQFKLADAVQTQRATLSDVLSHRLSLPPYAYDNLLEAGVMPETILNRYLEVKPVCSVGTCYTYQNVGFNMITSAIERVAKKDYTTVVKDRLFDPLKMTGASFGIKGLKRDTNWARPHRRNSPISWRVVDVKPAYYNVPAAGGINANILDMAKWLRAQMGYEPTVLPEATLDLSHNPIVTTPAEIRRNRSLTRLTEAHYGLGWRIYHYAGQTVINHSGAVEGYGSRIAFLPDLDVGIVTLTNSRSKAFWNILSMFLDYELGLENELLEETIANIGSQMDSSTTIQNP